MMGTECKNHMVNENVFYGNVITQNIENAQSY